MANPQPDKYIRISTELFEQLCRIRISGEARQVFDTLIRKTYGFQKKEDQVSLGQFAISTGLKRPTVAKAIKKLIIMNLVTKKDNSIYFINKDYDSWKPIPKKITLLPKKVRNHTQKGNRVLPKKVHTIDTITIDNIYREPRCLHEKVILIYKIMKGFKKEDRDWDDANFGRFCRPAKRLVKYLNKDLARIKQCMKDRKAHYTKQNISWTLDTIARDSLEWKKQQEE